MPPRPGANTPPEVSNYLDSMPTTTDVLERCVRELGYDTQDPAWFQENFTNAVRAFMDKGREVLHEEQEKARDHFDGIAGRKSDRAAQRHFQRQAEMSLSQQMKKRAGVHFERAIEWLLNKCEIPNEDGEPLTGRSDRVCPSIEMFQAHDERTVILEYKRTVRERWKEIRDEITKAGHSVWFITMDDHLSADVVRAMATSGITLYVTPDVYAGLAGVKNDVGGKLRSMDFLIEDIRHVVGSGGQSHLSVS